MSTQRLLKTIIFFNFQSDLTPLILAASGGRDKVVDTLLSEGANVNHKAHDDHSALQHAASKNWKSICANLIEKGADVNIADNRGATPLHRAASKGNIAIVQLLLDCASLKIGRYMTKIKILRSHVIKKSLIFRQS